MSNSSVDKTARAVCTGKKLNKIIHDNSFRHLAHPLSNLITFINGNNGFVVAMFSWAKMACPQLDNACLFSGLKQSTATIVPYHIHYSCFGNKLSLKELLFRCSAEERTDSMWLTVYKFTCVMPQHST